jgi:aryl-alcohol dehydrogenase-like predicted oxidoreductase
VAEDKGVTVAQLAIAWALSRGDDIVPLVGARSRARLEEALAALEVQLGPADLAQIEDAVPAGAAAGERYDSGQMAILDSERSPAGAA